MTYIILSFIFLFGLIIGSFLNCLVWRLHEKEGMWNRSYCPLCRKQIAWYDNIPILSFVLLGGKCRHCRKRISIQYPIVEFLTGVLFVLSFYFNYQLSITNYEFPFTFNFLTLTLRDWFVIAVMIVVFIYDLRWNLILDKVTLPACLAVFILNLVLGTGWLSLIVAGAIGGSFFLFQFLISRGKWIGGGDIRLGLLMGFSLGSTGHLILAILAAYFIGSIIGLALIISNKKKWSSEIPLGVFLASATIFTIFWGDKAINWYLGLF
ncbi:MAG: prepilin peptidase [Patescibacteria group bacterium]|nr:prepilin peptidase [Patescibacteria group bacterium]MDD5294768.1 prepilin peptidase [Patescibacteria group bacterium]MDD5554763.1 prepilin peptidase [Patescibacteria group bacterium]